MVPTGVGIPLVLNMRHLRSVPGSCVCWAEACVAPRSLNDTCPGWLGRDVRSIRASGWKGDCGLVPSKTSGEDCMCMPSTSARRRSTSGWDAGRDELAHLMLEDLIVALTHPVHSTDDSLHVFHAALLSHLDPEALLSLQPQLRIHVHPHFRIAAIRGRAICVSIEGRTKVRCSTYGRSQLAVIPPSVAQFVVGKAVGPTGVRVGAHFGRMGAIRQRRCRGRRSCFWVLGVLGGEEMLRRRVEIELEEVEGVEIPGAR